MSILGAMFTAVSGVNAQSKSLGHISDNIANSQTTGYKKVDTRFETLITVSNANLHQPGGVVASPSYANSLQGNVNQTQTLTNMAISGQGFFVVSRPESQTANQTLFNDLPYYTRAGDFEVNRDGYLVNNGGYYLNGWAVDEQTGVADTSTLAPIRITQTIDEPTPTSELEFVGNLPASSKVNPTPALAPTNIKVYDALGNPHTVSLVWAKRADNLWKLDIVAADSTLDPVSGTLVGVNDQAMAVANTTANVPAVSQVDTITLPSDGLAFGQSLTFTIGSNSVTVTAPVGGYTQSTVGSALIAAINGNPGLSAQVTAGNLTATTFDVSADVGGTPFSLTLGGSGSGQTDTVTIPNTGLAAGDTISVTINGTLITYTAVGVETAQTARDGLIALINANVTVNAQVTASPGATNTLLINADAAQGTFTNAVSDTLTVGALTLGTATGASSVNTVANGLPTAQVDTVTLSGTVGPGEIGDTYTINVGSQTISYIANGTETSLNDVAIGIAALINANSSLGVTATALGSTVQLTAINAGTPFTSTVAASNGSTNSFIDVQFGATAATAGQLVGISNAYNINGNAVTPTAQNSGADAVITFQVDYGVGPQTIELNLGKFQTTEGVTQFSGNTIDVRRFTQDGVPQGIFKDLNIRDNGDVELNYDNGRSRIFFKVPIAQFYDANTLKRESGQAFTETFDSGSARMSGAGENGAGTLRGSAVEGSNVDIAEEFSKMIVTQRSYSANTRVITTADEMLQDIINIKR
ncbi:flagellar hook-basal body complex protein [Dongia rigui]|uniref:Flagellar hook protein FlgE n=1 Tax=Dongia rigui TaxID=940149 RepID=A0ABU5DT84_9PROT|nr:flagellar hook-basal body complex protein [Dongia rigui]MDY0870554.1 flagellar hook-basal body complex protein [Dongia rigui]